jgi:hypothetical protein
LIDLLADFSACLDVFLLGFLVGVRKGLCDDWVIALILMDVYCVAVPTLLRYDLLERLCRHLTAGSLKGRSGYLVVLDNGGELTRSAHGRAILDLKTDWKIEVRTPAYNLGVAGSWNYFARELGPCFIANDDTVFSVDTLDCFLRAAIASPRAILFEGADPVAGFSTFFLRRPAEWMAMGGFDELLNPAYFEDNDCRYRLKLAGNDVVRVPLHGWSHDNSSTLSGASDSYRRMHWCLFQRNKGYYYAKWGGGPGEEVFTVPFQSFSRG